MTDLFLLSEAQMGRIAAYFPLSHGIARAVLRDAPVLLLDEATSALDSESEAKECQSAHGAVREAQRLAHTSAGAVAFSRIGDPSSGEFADAVVIKAFGDVPSADMLLIGE